MVFSEVWQCWYRWKWIGRALKHCRSRWDHLDMVFRRKVIATSGIRLPSWNFWVKEASGEVGIYTSEKRVPKHRYSHWYHVDISSRHQLITTSGFRPPSWIYKCIKCYTRLEVVRRRNLRSKIVGISSLASTEPYILLGYLPPPLPPHIYTST